MRRFFFVLCTFYSICSLYCRRCCFSPFLWMFTFNKMMAIRSSLSIGWAFTSNYRTFQLAFCVFARACLFIWMLFCISSFVSFVFWIKDPFFLRSFECSNDANSELHRLYSIWLICKIGEIYFRAKNGFIALLNGAFYLNYFPPKKVNTQNNYSAIFPAGVAGAMLGKCIFALKHISFW